MPKCQGIKEIMRKMVAYQPLTTNSTTGLSTTYFLSLPKYSTTAVATVPGKVEFGILPLRRTLARFIDD